jgi:NADPH-dependent glutamate synthase beta subunit-like oxidoreductase
MPRPGACSPTILAYRLPAEVVRRQVAALEGMGITFRLGARVGERGLSLATLRRRHDGVFLATGAWVQKALGLAHEGLLTPGLDFLRGIREGTVAGAGRRVLVIGGGNVALDVAVSALRLGAEEVTAACLRTATPCRPSEDVEQALASGYSCPRGATPPLRRGTLTGTGWPLHRGPGAAGRFARCWIDPSGGCRQTG